MRASFGMLLILILVSSVCLAQQQKGETINIPSYYPSPYGVYRTLRLFPNENNNAVPYSSCLNPGEIYYDKTDHKAYLCSASSSSSAVKWRPLVGGEFLGFSEKLTVDVPRSGAYKVVQLNNAPNGARFVALYVYAPNQWVDGITILYDEDPLSPSNPIQGIGRIYMDSNTEQVNTSTDSGHYHDFDTGASIAYHASGAVVPININKEFIISLHDFSGNTSGSVPVEIFVIAYLR